MHIIAAKAVAFKEALLPSFKEYQLRVVQNAATLAASLMEQGVDLVSGGTDNHMLLLDLTRLEITGKAAEAALGHAGITVNKNAIPFDTKSPMVTSGIRIGTPAVTTRGMGEAEMREIANIIVMTLRHPENEGILEKARIRIKELCSAFPLEWQ